MKQEAMAKIKGPVQSVNWNVLKHNDDDTSTVTLTIVFSPGVFRLDDLLKLIREWEQ